jgi:putative acetyltransferase
LETGSQVEYEPARAMYSNAGFEVCGPYAGYPDSGHSVFMTLAL